MPTTTKYPVGNAAAGGAFNGSWTNPNNAHAADAVYATAAPGKNQEFASVWNLQFLVADIPDGATINSVTVEYRYKVSTTASVATIRSTSFVEQAQSTAIGASPGDSDATEQLVDTTRSYSIPATLAQLRSFWVRVQALRGNNNTAVTFSLDFVRVTVDWTADSTVPVVNVTSAATAKISREPGWDSYSFSFSADEACQAWQIRIVPATTSLVTDGTLVESGGALTAGQVASGTLTDDELVAAGIAVGANIVKFFTQDTAGNWSV